MDTIFFIVFVLFSTFIIFRYGTDMIIYILPYNILADTFLYFTKDTWIIHSGNLRAIFLLLFILYYFFKKKYQRTNYIVYWAYIFIVFCVITIAINSSSLFISYQYFIKVCIYLLLMRISFDYFDNLGKMQRFAKWTVISAFMIIIINIVLQIFQLGESNYVQGTFNEAGGGSATLIITFIAISLPIISVILTPKKQLHSLIFAVIYIASIIFVLLSFRRTSWFYFSFSLFLQYLFTRQKASKSVGVILTGLVVFIFIIFLQSTILDIYEARYVKVERRIENEGRFTETYDVYDKIIYKNDLITNLFGREAFNFSTERNVREFGVDRQYHSISSILFDGVGLIGVSIFAIFIFQILYYIYKYRYYLKNKSETIINLSLYLLLFSYLLQIASFGFELISTHSYIFVTIAMTLNYKLIFNRKAND